ncbi:MAG: histidine kinase [Thermoclostridium sp.]|nr:histidine kinase [Thermoclostridium sp.]
MFIITQAISATIAASILAYIAANARRNRSTFSYMLCIFLLMLWQIAEIGVILAQEPMHEMLALKVKFLPVVYVGQSWLYFCLSTGHSRLVDKKWFVWTLFTIPAIFYLFMVTNEFHHLFFREGIYEVKNFRGPVFWIHAAVSYSCILLGTIYLFASMKRKFGKSTRERNWLLMAVLLPMTANALMLMGVIPNRGLDITSYVMLFTLTFFGVAVYQKRFLNLIPVAARHFIENTSLGMIIIDHEELVVGVNEAISRILPDMQLKIHDPVEKIINYFQKNSALEIEPEIVEAISGTRLKPAEGYLKLNGLYLYIEARVLTGVKEAPNGRLLILKDRSEEQQLIDEINTKNHLLTKTNERLTLSNSMLTEANQRLEQLSTTIEELAISKERNRVGREVHDTIGHTLTILVALAENMKLQLNDNQKEIANTLDESIFLSRQALNDIRSCLNGFPHESFKSKGLSEWMNQLLKINDTSLTNVEYSISGEMPELDATRVMAIYRICQESITNSIRHGQAQKVSIIIKCLQHSIRIYIFDDGKGCGEIVKGYGLTGMEQRIKKLGGSISFGSDGEKGFNIIAELPLPEQSCNTAEPAMLSSGENSDYQPVPKGG